MLKAKRVVSNTIILYGQMGITVLLSLYTVRLVLAALGSEDYGLFILVGGIISMMMFVSHSMAAASQRFMSYSSGEGDLTKQIRIFNISLKLHVLIAIVMIVVLQILGIFLFEDVLNISIDRLDTAKFIYQCLIVSTFFVIISVPYDAVVNAHENMLFVAITRTLEVVLKFFIAIYITDIEADKLFFYGFLTALVSIAIFFVKLIYSHLKYDEVIINFKKFKNKGLNKEIVDFAGWSFLGSASSMIGNYGQSIIINIFFNTKVNAAQGISAQVSGQLGAFANIMLKALNPVLAKSEGSGDRNLMLKASMIGSKFSFFLLVFFYVPIILEMQYIFDFWLKEIPKYAIIFCILLLIRNLIEQFFITLDSSISAVGDIKNYQIITSILNFIPLLATVVFFYFGYEPYIMYFIFIIYAFIKGSIILHFSKIKCGLSILFFLQKVIKPCVIVCLGTLLLSAIPIFTLESGIYRFFLVGIISITSFFVFVWNFGIDNQERFMTRKIFMSFITKKK